MKKSEKKIKCGKICGNFEPSTEGLMGWNEKHWVENGLFYAAFAVLNTLGFTHFCKRNKRGNFMVGRKTEKSRLKRSIASLTETMRTIRHYSLKEQTTEINQILRGHYAYYGMGGNIDSLKRIYRFVINYWHKMLSSRSQKGYVPWEKFEIIKTTFPLQIPRLRIPYSRMKSYSVL